VSRREPVSDPADPRVADYIGLSDPDLRRHVEAQHGFFVAESPRVIETVARAGRRIRSVLLTPAQAAALAPVLDPLGVTEYVAPPDVMREVVGFDLHRGAVAVVERWPLPELRAVLDGAPRVAVLEGIVDHENLGMLFRNAAAFGIGGVVLDGTCADPLYRRSVRVSIGHVCTVPWTRYSNLGELRAAGLVLVALTPARDARAIDEFTWPARGALMVGSEGPGLSGEALAAADVRVRIPMAPGVDSLNVATAAAIAFHASTLLVDSGS
jgi:tRNA G18 (ribose-2'-O)-methylase SpoU